MTLKEIKLLPPAEAIERINTILSENPQDEEALTARGLCHWALSHRADAIRDYLAAIRINPDSKAAEALRQAREILEFRNNDLLNP